MSTPTLLKEIEQFLYTHAPNMPHKKTLLSLVKTWEEAYVQRIQELETPSLENEFDRMVSEGGDRSNEQCDCDIVRYPPCAYCQARDY